MVFIGSAPANALEVCIYTFSRLRLLHCWHLRAQPLALQVSASLRALASGFALRLLGALVESQGCLEVDGNSECVLRWGFRRRTWVEAIKTIES